MNHSLDKSVRHTRFAIAELQKRISILEATREDLERQIKKLSDSVPEEKIDPDAQREGYVSYGTYAKSVIERRENIRDSLDDIALRHRDLAGELKTALDALDSFERLKARYMAAKAEKAMKRA